MNPCDQIFFLCLPSNIWCAAQIRQNPHMNHSKQSDESRGHQSPEVGTKLHNDQSETCWDTSVWTKTMNQSTNQPTAILSLKGTVHLIVKHTLFSPLTAALSIHPDCQMSAVEMPFFPPIRWKNITLGWYRELFSTSRIHVQQKSAHARITEVI